MGRWLLKVGGFFLFLTLNFEQAFAIPYDFIGVDKNDIQHMSNAKVEAEYRLFLIKKATSSIDLITYDQRMDEVGVELLNALTEAAKRGVRIRFALSWIPVPIEDPLNHIKAYLKKANTAFPNFEFRYVSSPSKWTKNWNKSDSIHEKLLIVDRQYVVTTGRGHGEQYFHWLDTGFAIKGKLVQQSEDAFENLWKVILEESFNKTKAPSTAKDIEGAVRFLAETKLKHSKFHIPLNEMELEKLISLVRWAETPSDRQVNARGRVLHHDLLAQLRVLPKKPSEYSNDQRLDLVRDPYVEEIISELNVTAELKIAMLSTIFHPKLKKSILERLRAPNFKLTLFTNSKQSHLNILPINFAVGWYAGLTDLVDLLQSKNSVAYTLRGLPNEDPKYLHRKLVILERDKAKKGKESVVLFGSHNLTYASTVVTDELSFEVESDEFANEMSTLYLDSVRLFANQVNKDELQKEVRSCRVRCWISSLFKWAY